MNFIQNHKLITDRNIIAKKVLLIVMKAQIFIRYNSFNEKFRGIKRSESKDVTNFTIILYVATK